MLKSDIEMALWCLNMAEEHLRQGNDVLAEEYCACARAWLADER